MATHISDDLTQGHAHEVMPGLAYEWHFDRQAVTYHLTSVSQRIIDGWAELVIELLQQWPGNRPYLAHHDMAAPGISLQFAVLTSFDTMNLGITPAGFASARQILRDRNIAARVAVSFNLSMSGQINHVLAGNRNANSANDADARITYRTFYSAEKALTWLISSSAPQRQIARVDRT